MVRGQKALKKALRVHLRARTKICKSKQTVLKLFSRLYGMDGLRAVPFFSLLIKVGLHFRGDRPLR